MSPLVVSDLFNGAVQFPEFESFIAHEGVDLLSLPGAQKKQLYMNCSQGMSFVEESVLMLRKKVRSAGHIHTRGSLRSTQLKLSFTDLLQSLYYIGVVCAGEKISNC